MFIKKRYLWLMLLIGIIVTTAFILDFLDKQTNDTRAVLSDSDGVPNRTDSSNQSIKTSIGSDSSLLATDPAQVTQADRTAKSLNKLLIDKLDKTSDETIRYVYNISHDNIKVENTYEGNFTGSGKTELLVVFKLLDVPHAGGLDCHVAAVYDKTTLELVAQRNFPADKCWFDILKDNKGRSYLLFSGTTTYQGNTSYMLMLFKPGKDWEQLLPQEYSVYSQYNYKYEYTLLNNGLVGVSEPVYNPEDNNAAPEMKRKYLLRWDPDTASLNNFTPETFLDGEGKNYFEAYSVSPDGRYAVVSHEWGGFDEGSYILLYDIRGNRLAGKYDMLAMHFGFLWSPDSRKVCISRLARLWVEISILEIGDSNAIKVADSINAYDLFKSMGIKLGYSLSKSRPDPAYTPIEWSPDSKKLLVFYQWNDMEMNPQGGTFVYDVKKKTVSHILQNRYDPNVDNLVPKKPEGFKW